MRGCAGTVMLIVVCLAGGVRAGEAGGAPPAAADASALQKELEAALVGLRELREGYYARKQASEERLAALGEQIESLTDERDALTEEQERLAADAKELKGNAERLGEAVEWYRTLRAGVRGAVEGFAKEQSDALAGGLPHRVPERRVLLSRLERDLASATVAVSTWVELAWLFAESELREAAEGAAYTSAVTLSYGRRKPARFFHLGQVLVGFVTEDGEEAGYAELAGGVDGGFRWKTDASDALASELREAVRILDRREPPRLLLLPLFVRPQGEGAQ